jgi:hypothetical protein
MKILKSNTLQIFDTENVDRIEIHKGPVPDCINSLFYHLEVSEYEFLIKKFGKEHRIMDNFSHSYYYIV